MSPSRKSRSGHAAGLTLFELMIAMTIMSFIALGLGMMGSAARQSSSYAVGRAAAMQHARVTLERIDRMVQEACLAPDYPGVALVYDLIGTYRFPDTLIVWHPASTPANANGPPLISECYFYCPDPAKPSQLVEITAPTNTSTITLDPTVLNTSSWRTTLTAIKTASTSQKTVLTDLLRSANPTGSSTVRGCVRFDVQFNPPATELASYRSGSLAWSNMGWPVVMYSASHGLRQIRVGTELQLLPEDKAGTLDNVGAIALPFFGSTARFQMLKP